MAEIPAVKAIVPNELVLGAVARLETELSPEETLELTAVKNIAVDNGYGTDTLVYAKMLTTRAKVLRRLAVAVEGTGYFKPKVE